MSRTIRPLGTTAADDEKDLSARQFFPISPIIIFPEATPDFRLYLKQADNFVLYTREKERFSDAHKRRLHDLGIRTVWVRQSQKPIYDRYVEEHLGKVLMNPDLPSQERSSVLYDTCEGMVREVFQQRMPGQLSGQLYERILGAVTTSVRFLTMERSLASIGGLISHNYKTFSHCVNVFVFATAIYSSFGPSEKDLVTCGLGAILHDIGKSMVPKAILDKPGKLAPDEWELMRAHPLHGIAMCSMLSIPQESANCILFHHERVDGAGYPTGLSGDNLPLVVKIVTLCDVYDALTSDRPYAAAVSPFEALSIMRDQMRGAFDMEVFKRLVSVLSGANLL